MSVRYEVKGVTSVEQGLRTIAKALDPVALLDEVSAVILSRIRIRFRAELDPNGKQWEPLRPRTIADRLRKGFGASPILYRTGLLFNSIQLAKDGEFSRQIRTDVFYASYLQGGNKEKHLPARPFIGVSNDDIPVLTQVIVTRIKDAIS